MTMGRKPATRVQESLSERTTKAGHGGKGKQKIEIKRIDNKKKSQVTFSKRRHGLFTKAAEIDALCGSETAVVAISAGGKLFSTGRPSVIRRYILHQMIRGGEGDIGSWWGLLEDDGELDSMGVEELERELGELEELQRIVLARPDKLAATSSARAGPPNVEPGHCDDCGGKITGMDGGNFDEMSMDLIFEGLEPLDSIEDGW